jgi:hypothetical protein
MARVDLLCRTTQSLWLSGVVECAFWPEAADLVAKSVTVIVAGGGNIPTVVINVRFWR